MTSLNRHTPAIMTLAILGVVVGNLTATIRGVSMLEIFQRNAKIQAEAQDGQSNWTDHNGVQHQIETPRLPGENREEWLKRHAEAMELFTVAFPLESQ
jgi:hypothetical protein